MTDLEQDAPASGNDDLRSALESAWTADSTPPASATPAKPETSAPVESAAPEAKADRARNPDGTFAEKPKEAAGEKPIPTGQAAPAAETGQPATRKAPASWPKEYHDPWNKLDPAIQDQILKREADVDRGFQEKAAKYKPYDELEPIIAQKRQTWRLNGWSDAQAIQRLVAAQDVLDRDPAGGVRWIAQSYGLHPEQIFPQQPAASNQPDPLAQYLAPVFQELQQLKGTITAQQQAEQERQNRAVLSQIESFASKDHPHLETVYPDMVSLLNNDGAQGTVPERLQAAYDKAIWMNPDIRRQILDEQARAQASSSTAEVEKAKRAASSVTGAPTGGAPTRPAASLREELEAAFG